ncbi:MAG: 30S ribosome-binding factor RbfA [Myxococcales bacterium]|nr:30S ribosome-binding factor RbfA [Myxococcales bacterium]MCB9566189.1 30S ribosome-binding factor RbfA [Myxococcales bacterium]MCB9702752.1 30S ribosome-binding factor RbfA [Myxococcales bacterium]
MSTRLQRIEETLRRAIADVLLFGGLRDPRLQGVNLGVTGVKVTPDLQQARVFVDIMGEGALSDGILAALRAATPVIRAELAHRVHLRRLPTLRFERDEAIARGLRIEEVIAEIHATDAAHAADAADAEGEEAQSAPAAEAHATDED